MKKQKLLQKLLSGTKNIRFAEAVACARMFGFRLDRTKGSHHNLCPSRHPGVGQFAECRWQGQAVPDQTIPGVDRATQPSDGGRMMKDYHVNVFYSDEDKGYIADIPDLKNCSAFGATPEAALREALKAKKAWIEAARANGKPVPPPRFRPVIYQVV